MLGGLLPGPHDLQRRSDERAPGFIDSGADLPVVGDDEDITRLGPRAILHVHRGGRAPSPAIVEIDCPPHRGSAALQQLPWCTDSTDDVPEVPHKYGSGGADAQFAELRYRRHLGGGVAHLVVS